MSLDKWLETYKEVGKREGYTEEEIGLYGHILKGFKLYE